VTVGADFRNEFNRANRANWVSKQVLINFLFQVLFFPLMGKQVGDLASQALRDRPNPHSTTNCQERSL
jgi:hypothetical protein